MSIAGSPGGVEAAAGTVEGAGRDFTDAADSIASHGRAVAADWTGSAAEAAGAAIAALADRTRVGTQVCAGIGPVLRAYAAELRAAQGQYDDGSATAHAGASAQRSATAAARSAGAMAQDDPGRADAQSAAVRAGDRADAEVRAGQASMTAAVGRAERANAAAAAAIDALTDQLDDMTATTTPVQSTSGDWSGAAVGDWGDRNPPSGSGAEEHHHGWFYNILGGLGNAAWSAGPGPVGDVAGWSPFAADKAVGRRIKGAHDWLAGWYGADTDSRAYRGSDGVGQVATFFIPGEGWVKGAEAATKADDALRLGDEALHAVDQVGAAARADTRISAQRQERHVLGGKGFAGGGYFTDAADAQRVLDAYHSGDATVVRVGKNGNVYVRYEGVTGFNNNRRAGYLGQPTNQFMIKGTKSVSVVPVAPGG